MKWFPLFVLLLFVYPSSLKCGGLDPDSTAQATRLKYEKLAELYQAGEDKTRLLPMLRKASDKFEQLPGDFSPEVSKYRALLIWLRGKVLYDLGRYLEAKPLLELAEIRFRKIDYAPPALCALLYQPLGNIHTRLGDYEKAEAYLQMAREIAEKQSRWKDLVQTLSDLAILYRDLERWQEAGDLPRMALGYGNVDPTATALVRLNLGSLLADPENPNGNVQEGLRQLKIGIDGILSAGADKPSNTHLPEAHRELAHAYERLDQPDSALFHYRYSFRLLLKIDPTMSRREFAKTLVPLAGLERRLGQIDSAMAHVQLALSSVLPGKVATDGEGNPPASALYPENAIMEALTEKAHILTDRYEMLCNPSDLHTALGCHRLISLVEDTLQHAYIDNRSKRVMAAIRHRRTEHAIATCRKLWSLSGDAEWLKLAFIFAERAKSAVLRENMIRREALFRTNTGSQALIRMNDLQRQIRNWQSQQTVEGARDSILRLQKQYETLLSGFKASNPAWFSSVFQQEPIPADELQDTLQANGQVLLEYYAGEQHIYVFALDGVGISLFQIDKPGRFEEMIESYLHSLIDNTDSLVPRTLEVFRTVFAPIRIPATDRLLIIPDGQLFKVPFHALFDRAPRQADQFQNYAYLIRRYGFSYAYSAQIWLRQNNQTNMPVWEIPFSGFAPVDFRQNPNTYLSLEVTQDLARQWGGRCWSHGEATANNFWAATDRSAILFLATHAIGRDTQSYFLLSAGEKGGEDTIWLSDLYLSERKVTAELSVLMACETALGKISSGESAESIGTGMALAGCPGVITTQWQIPERQAVEVLRGTFAGLAEGMPRDLALRQAVLNYLDQGDYADSWEAAPEKWAALGIWGSSRPLGVRPVSRRGHWWLWLGLVVVGLLGIAAYRRWIA